MRLLLRILQSEGEILDEYTKGARTEVTRRLGSPVVFTTTTLEQMVEDDATRFLRIPVDETPDQTLAVMKATIDSPTASGEPTVEVWQQAILDLAERAKVGFVFPPFLDHVAGRGAEGSSPYSARVGAVSWGLQAVALCKPPVGAPPRFSLSQTV